MSDTISEIEIIDQFRRAAAERGIVVPDRVIADGKIHRCDTDKRNGHGDAAYSLHLDEFPFGGFQNWQDGQGWEAWCARDIRRMTSTDRAQFQHKRAAERVKREAEIKEKQTKSAARARSIWDRCVPSPDDHPYLARKGVRSHGLGSYKGCAVVPLRDETDKVVNLQFIRPEPGGDKRFLTWGRKKGCYFAIGEPGENPCIICIGEGYATMASVHEATDCLAIVAFDHGNLEPVARFFRKRYPRAGIIICADDDVSTDGNPGIAHAKKAAAAIKGLVAVPEFGADRRENATDWNDLAEAKGQDAVKEQIERVSRRTVPVVYRCAAEIEPKNVKWLWPDRIPSGKIVLLGGLPDQGKSQVGCYTAAIVSTGGMWPDESRAKAGNVIILSAEDDASDTIVPRLIAADADLSRIFMLDAVREYAKNGDEKRRVFNLKTDIDELDQLIWEIGGAALIIVDVIDSYMGETDSHRNAAVRGVLAPLKDLAARHGATILGLTHFSKDEGKKAVLRFIGSIGFIGQSRAGWIVTEEKGEDGEPTGRYLFLRAKGNLGPKASGLAYRIEGVTLADGIETSRIVWDGTVSLTADEALTPATHQNGPSALDEAVEFLETNLVNGSVAATEIKELVKAEGYSLATVRRARSKLKVIVEKDGYQGQWNWSLPPQRCSSDAKDAQVSDMSTFEENERLWTEKDAPDEAETSAWEFEI